MPSCSVCAAASTIYQLASLLRWPPYRSPCLSASSSLSLRVARGRAGGMRASGGAWRPCVRRRFPCWAAWPPKIGARKLPDYSGRAQPALRSVRLAAPALAVGLPEASRCEAPGRVISDAKKAPPKPTRLSGHKGGWVWVPAEPYFETNSHAPSSRYPTLGRPRYPRSGKIERKQHARLLAPTVEEIIAGLHATSARIAGVVALGHALRIRAIYSRRGLVNTPTQTLRRSLVATFLGRCVIYRNRCGEGQKTRYEH